MMLLLLVMMTMVMTMVAPRAESETVGSGADAGHFGATRWWETRAGAPVGSAQQPGKHTLEEETPECQGSSNSEGLLSRRNLADG